MQANRVNMVRTYLGLLGCLAALSVLTVILVVIEIQYPSTTNKFSLVKALLIVIGGISLLHSPPAFLQQLQRYAWWICLVYVCFFVLLTGLKIINIYEFGVLPPWFYQLKLYRLVTLSSDLLVTWLVYFSGMWLMTHHRNLPASSTVRSLHTAHLVLIALLITTCSYMLLALASVHQHTIQAWQNLDTPFAERMTYRLGGTTYYGWIWPYSQFIKKHTEPQAQILIPPWSDTWKMEGNPDYFRWFMYPRTLVHLDPDGSIPEETNYILISYGECSNGACGWPTFSVPAGKIEKIMYLDRQTQEEQVIEGQGYTPDLAAQRWGVIQLRKN